MGEPGTENNFVSTLQDELDSIAKDISEKVIEDRIFVAERFRVQIYDQILAELQLIVKDSLAEMIRIFETEDLKSKLIEFEYLDTVTEIETELGGHLDENGKYTGSENLVEFIIKSYFEDSDPFYGVFYDRVSNLFCFSKQIKYCQTYYEEMDPAWVMNQLLLEYASRYGTLLRAKFENDIIKSFARSNS